MKNKKLLLATLACICISTQLNAGNDEKALVKKSEPAKSEASTCRKQLAFLNQMSKTPQGRQFLATYAKQEAAKKAEAALIKGLRPLVQKKPTKPNPPEPDLTPHELANEIVRLQKELPLFFRVLVFGIRSQLPKSKL